jgi:hypothetical protein
MTTRNEADRGIGTDRIIGVSLSLYIVSVTLVLGPNLPFHVGRRDTA